MKAVGEEKSLIIKRAMHNAMLAEIYIYMYLKMANLFFDRIKKTEFIQLIWF